MHLWGTPSAVEALSDIVHRHSLELMFDAAHAFGARPTALHGRHDYDTNHLQYALDKSRDAEDVKAYLFDC